MGIVAVLVQRKLRPRALARCVPVLVGILYAGAVHPLRAQDKPAGSAVATLSGQILCCKDCWESADRTKVEYGTAEDRERAYG